MAYVDASVIVNAHRHVEDRLFDLPNGLAARSTSFLDSWDWSISCRPPSFQSTGRVRLLAKVLLIECVIVDVRIRSRIAQSKTPTISTNLIGHRF